MLIAMSFIWAYPIYILDEARNSEAAREMLVSGDFIVPRFNGQLRTDKPPLHYFFMMLGYKLFGVGPLGARFFSGLFGAVTIWFTYWNVKMHKGTELALMTSLILLSALFYVQEFHLAVPDPYLICFMCISFFSIFNFVFNGKSFWLILFYIAVGSGILTKGPVALVLPGLVVPLFLLNLKEFNLKTILGLRPFLGLILVLAIAGPWYYLVHTSTNGAWTQGFFLDHNFSRFGEEKEGHGGPFFITFLFVVLGLLPFSVFSIQGFAEGWRGRKTDSFVFYSFLVSSVTILFFSISSTKLPNYPMVCYPFVAILIASFLQRIYHGGVQSKNVLWSLSFLVLLSVILPIGGYIALGLEKELHEVKNSGLWLVLLPIAAILSFIFFKRNELIQCFFSISMGWVIMGFCLFGIIYPKLTVKSPVIAARAVLSSDSNVIAYKRFDSAFPINFTTTYQVFDSIEDVKLYLKETPNTFIITNTREKCDLEALNHFEMVLEHKSLFETHVTRIYVAR